MSINYDTDEVFDQDAPVYLVSIITVPRRHGRWLLNYAPCVSVVANQKSQGVFYRELELVGEKWNLSLLMKELRKRNCSYSYSAS